MFTDLVGSTASRRQLGDTRAEQLRGVVDAAQVEAIEAQQGRVVKSTGDGIMAVFVSAGNALAAAVQLQAGVRAATKGSETPVELRVGISAGDVSDDAGDLFGIPVVEAARLCDVATGGEILLSDVVRALSGSWAEFELVDRGDVELKGLGSIRHWALEWVDTPDPTATGVGLLVDEEFPFVGRASEIAGILEVWTRATTGRQAAALVTGEAGLGKTRLIVEAARRVRLDGALVVSGRCEERGTSPLMPFEAVSEMLLEALGPTEFRRAGGPFLDELCRHYPGLASSLGANPGPADSDPEAERWRLVTGLTRLLREVAQRQKTALIIDDVQWADPASLSFIEKVLRTEDMGSLCVLMTARDTADDLNIEAREFLSHVHRLTWVHRLEMKGLGSRELKALIDQAKVKADVGAIWEQTHGHPFFVSELVRFARDSGSDDAGVPRSIKDLLAGRIGRLSGDAVELLTIGAMAGSEFDLSMVAAIAEQDDLQAVSAAEEAVAARLLIEVPDQFDRYQFPHRLIADAIGAMTSTSRKARIHRSLAEALVSSGGIGADVARHLQAAVPLVPLAEAVDATRRTAFDAIRRGSPDQAVSLLEGAIDLEVDGSTRIELELLIGQAFNYSGDPASGVPWLQKAAEGAVAYDRFDVLVEAALACWAGNPWVENADQRAPDLLQLALDRCPPDDEVSRTRLEAGLAAFSIFTARLEQRDTVTAKAVEVARETEDPALLSNAMVSRYTAVAAPLGIDALEQVDRDLAELKGVDDLRFVQDVPVASAPGLMVGVSASQFWRGDGDAYRAAVSSFDLDDPRTPDWVATVGYQLRAVLRILEGNLEEAVADAEHAAQVGGWGDASRGNHMWQRLVIDWLRGDVASSRERVANLYGRFGGQPMRGTHAWVEAACGDLDASRALLERMRIDRLAWLPELFLGTLGLAGAAMAVWHLEDEEWASAAIDAFAPVVDLVCGVPWAPLPCGHFFTGMMHLVRNDNEAAAESFRAAQPIHARLGAVSFEAMTNAGLVRSLRAIDAAAAAEVEAETESMATGLGLPGVIALAGA